MAESNFEKLLGKNGELVEYREKQVLEGAFGIIRRHYGDKLNKMEPVAKLFGKKLGEKFKIKYLGYIHTVVFTADGLKKKQGDYYVGGCLIDFDALHVLLTGLAEIVGDEK